MTEYVIYSSLLDDADKQGYAHSGIDAEVSLSRRIAEELGAEVSTDAEEHGNEILIGKVARGECDRALASLKLDQYGVFCYGSRVAVCGHCVAATMMACELFLATEREKLIDGYCDIRTVEEWSVDFPEFPYGAYLGMTDCSYGRIELVYGSTSELDVEHYRAILAKAGYACAYSHAIEGNLFYRYEKGDAFLHIVYHFANRRVELISGDVKRCKVVTPVSLDASIGAPVRVSQLALDYSGGSFGMGYVITLEDGSFVIIDGGNVRVQNGYPKTYDYVRLYTLLKELNRREDGQIVISAWFMTHEHADHYGVFYWFCREYGDRVTVKAYYDCSCSDAVSFNAKNPDYLTTRGRLDRAQQWAGGFDRVTLMAGDVLRFGEVSFEILYTVDQLFPDRLTYFNDSSFVCTMEYKGQRIMWLGDVCTAPSRFLREHYSEKTLRSDIVQLAHHGLNGAEKELYDLIDAKVLFWSLRYKLVDAIFESEPIEDHKKLAHYLKDEMHVEEIITHTRHNDTLTLPYTLQEGERVRL